MKTEKVNSHLSRRNLIKSISLLGAGLLLPQLKILNQAESLPIHYLGFGGAGSNIIEALQQSVAKGRYTCISSPARPNMARDINFIELNLQRNQSSDYHFGIESYLRLSNHFELPEAVLNIFNPAEKYVLFSGLGGLTGSLLTAHVSLLLNEKNIAFKTIVSLPFSFEGSKRKGMAQAVVKNLAHLHQFKYMELDYLRQQHGSMKLKEAFAKADRDLISLS